MASTTVAQFAAELKMPADVLLEQFKSAGVSKSSQDDPVTEADKGKLLESLRKAHGSADSGKKKITLTRRQTSEIKQSGPGGRARTVQVEVRKKRVFVQRDEKPETSSPPKATPAPALDPAEAARREVEAQRQAELKARQEADLKEKQERLQKELAREKELQQQAQKLADAEKQAHEASEAAKSQSDTDQDEAAAEARKEAAKKAEEA
ncbi:MAG: translation initiation factor IF-2 associated domain-containing protein, partial [Limnobacter sp.]|nr:translation initiation factor IF-2 associated domain-containing protein [Limnobacter sp.]